MKYAELRKQVADAQAALKEERALKVEKLRDDRAGRLNKIAIKVSLDGRGFDPSRVMTNEQTAAERIVRLLMHSGVLTRRTELTHSGLGMESEVTFTLLVGTERPTQVIDWREVQP